MTLNDKNLQEATLFELFQSDAYSDTTKSLKLAQATIVNKINSIKTDTWNKKRLRLINKAIADSISKAYKPLVNNLQKELKEVTKVTAKNVLGVENYKVPINSINKINQNSLAVQGYTISSLFKTNSENHTRQLQVILGAGVARGETAQTLTKKIISKSNKLTKGQLKTAVHSTVTEARTLSRHESYNALEKTGLIEGYEFVATLDSGTSEYCRNHDNLRYWKPIEEISHLINVHFNCRSVFSPLTKTSKTSTRASINAPVKDESYSKWFAKQDDYFQESTLGRKKYNLYKRNIYKIGSVADIKGKKLKLNQINEILSKNNLLNIISSKAKDTYSYDILSEISDSYIDYPDYLNDLAINVSGNILIQRAISGDKQYRITKSFDFENKKVNLDSVFLKPSSNEKDIFISSLSLYEKVGISKITANAEQVGSYVLLKYGFQPNDKKEFIKTIQKSVARNHPRYTTTVNAYLKKWGNGNTTALMDLIRDIEIIKNVLVNQKWDGTFYLKDEKTINRITK